jgi:hypothetical protein
MADEAAMRITLPSLLALSLLPFLSACGAGGVDSASSQPAMPMAGQYGRGAHGLIGLDARHLIAQLGQPRLDIRDRTVRKLQFARGRCIIDAYLYAPARGREPVSTYVESRLASGEDVSLSICGIQ